MIVAGIEMPLRSDGDCSGVCVGGDQQRWKKGGRVMERHKAGGARIRRESNAHGYVGSQMGPRDFTVATDKNEETWVNSLLRGIGPSS